MGDLEEQYNEIRKNKGTFTAHLYYWIQLMVVLPGFIKNSVYWTLTMVKNYIRVALRNLKKHKGFSFINVTGLAVGMAVCIFILLWVQNELSFDTFHENGNDLYVVVTTAQFGKNSITWPGTPPAFGPAVTEEYPEIINAVRLQNGTQAMVLSYKNKQFREEVQLADPSLLQVFNFPLISGNPQTALSDPHSLVITERLSEKYFGNSDPMGKVLRVDNRYDFKITGILKNLPANSSIRFDCIAPLSFLKDLRGAKYLETWGNLSFWTYLQLQKHASYQQISQKIADRIERGGEKAVEAFLHPFKRLYLHWLDQGGGRIEQVRLFVLIGLLILFIACINFMNLTTARSGNRSKEIGIRKVTGANRKNLIMQFYGESMLMTFISLIFAILLVITLLPAFEKMTGRELAVDLQSNPTIIFGLIVVALVTSLVAGSYPALFLSSFQPVKTIKGSMESGTKKTGFRKILVVIQFAISLTLIIGTLVIYKQIKHMNIRDLGFNQEYLLYVHVPKSLKEHRQAIKGELLKNPKILNASFASHLPTGIYWNGSGFDWEGKDPEINPLVTFINVDPDFEKTLNIKMVEGKFFSRKPDKNQTEYKGDVVINEEFARIIGNKSPVGSRITQSTDEFIIKGVIKNFHFKPLRQTIGPMMMVSGIDRYRYLFLRLNSESNMSQTIRQVEHIYKQFSPDSPFEYAFLNDEYNRLYKSEQRLGSIITYFTGLAIFISCLGLFGLSSFMAEQRTREIGLRKVLGASSSSIIFMLMKEYSRWVFLAYLISLPAAYAIMHNWLRNFAYRTNISIITLILAGLAMFTIAISTVGYQSLKAAAINSAEALKHE